MTARDPEVEGPLALLPGARQVTEDVARVAEGVVDDVLLVGRDTQPPLDDLTGGAGIGLGAHPTAALSVVAAAADPPLMTRPAKAAESRPDHEVKQDEQAKKTDGGEDGVVHLFSLQGGWSPCRLNLEPSHEARVYGSVKKCEALSWVSPALPTPHYTPRLSPAAGIDRRLSSRPAPRGGALDRSG